MSNDEFLPGVSLRVTIDGKAVGAEVWTVSWSPNGRELVTSSADSADIWEIDPDGTGYRHSGALPRQPGATSGRVFWSPVDQDLVLQADFGGLTLRRLAPGRQAAPAVWSATSPVEQRVVVATRRRLVCAAHRSPHAPAFLVAARVDRGGIPVTHDRVLALCAEWGLSDYFATSAKEGWQIAELAAAVRQAIDWDALPRSAST